MSAAVISTARMLRTRFYEVGAEFPAVVVFDEAQESSMLNTPNYHAINVRFDRTVVKPTPALYLK